MAWRSNVVGSLLPIAEAGRIAHSSVKVAIRQVLEEARIDTEAIHELE